jgi:pimeloyl-ACP methyl ester carboxylesterase
MPNESFEKLQVDGTQIAYRRIGHGRPLVVLNGFAATSEDWDPSFIDRLASSNQLILLDNRGIGRSTDNGQPFDIAQLADDAARVIEILGIERTSLLGWPMGGFIAQTLALQHPGRINKRLKNRRVDCCHWFFRVTSRKARAQLSPDLVNRQAAAMDAWHRTGVGNRLREMNLPVLIATGTADIVIPPSNALKLVNAIPGAGLAQFNGGGHAFMYQYPRPLADLVNSFLELG